MRQKRTVWTPHPDQMGYVELEQRGLCQTGYAPPALWVSEKDKRRIRAAQICRSCPILDSCREQALKYFVFDGRTHVVVGGLTEREIRDLRRERGISAPRARSGGPLPVKILAINSLSKHDQGVAQKIRRAHRLGLHDKTPIAHCELCHDE